MDVELQVIPDCPGAQEAQTLLRHTLDDLGLADTQFAVRTIDTEELAREHRFAGSPAFVVDGADLFASSSPGGVLACRVYPTQAGPRNVPSPDDLRAALQARLSS